MDRLLFILNPIAGGGKAKDLQGLIEEKMEESSQDYDIILTKKPKDATKIAENSNHNTIIAVGGDGTVNEVAKGLINRGHGLLGIIPGGTGNDLSRILHISNDPLEAIDTILGRKVKEIDVGCANGHKFLNIGSIGFDAEVVINTDKLKNRVRGKFAY